MSVGSGGGSEYREDPLTGNWVILAPDRSSRPSDFSASREPRRALPDWDESCPFCPGNENLLTPIRDETEAAGPVGHAEPSRNADWQVRAVVNKYPAVTQRARDVSDIAEYGPGRRLPGHGFHEVVVEHPRHDMLFQDMSATEAGAVVRMWRRRYAALMESDGVEAVVLFRNHGSGAGTSLLHPHSQIVATAVAPPLATRLHERARAHCDAHGSCLLCDYIRQEEAAGERVLLATDHFLAAAPFAPDGRCELLVLPRSHGPDITGMTEAESADFAAVLSRIYGALHDALDDPDSNLAFHTATRSHREEPCSHWYARLRPRIGTPAGFELGSGISITPSLPEEDAAVLRKHIKNISI